MDQELGGHAGELFVCAELSKRGIPNALLPEIFSHDDILVSNKDGTQSGYVQVKACHPDSIWTTQRGPTTHREGNREVGQGGEVRGPQAELTSRVSITLRQPNRG